MYVTKCLKFNHPKVRVISRLGRKKFQSVNDSFPIPSDFVITGLFEQSLALYIWPFFFFFFGILCSGSNKIRGNVEVRYLEE